MEIPAAFDIVNRNAQAAAEEQVQHGEMGRDAFMQLLVNQLSNQNPLEPMTDQDFVAQLATFSSLEQLESINESVQASLLMNQSVNNTLATTLIGKEVLVEGNLLTLAENGDATFQLELAGEADVAVVIRDADGNRVRRLEAGKQGAGNSTIAWDGLDDNGVRVDPGSYDMEIFAKDEEGSDVLYSSKIRALVEGVQFIDGTGYLVVGNTTIPLSSVVEIYAGSNSQQSGSTRNPLTERFDNS